MEAQGLRALGGPTQGLRLGPQNSKARALQAGAFCQACRPTQARKTLSRCSMAFQLLWDSRNALEHLLFLQMHVGFFVFSSLSALSNWAEETLTQRVANGEGKAPTPCDPRVKSKG